MIRRREEAGSGLADERRERARAVKAINLILIDEDDDMAVFHRLPLSPPPPPSSSLASLIPSTQFPACFCRHCSDSSRIIVFHEPGSQTRETEGERTKIH